MTSIGTQKFSRSGSVRSASASQRRPLHHRSNVQLLRWQLNPERPTAARALEQDGGPDEQRQPPRIEEQKPELNTNVWAYKPGWCQPWSILATGGAFMAGVWTISGNSAGWTVAAAVPVVAWWVLFLGVMPAQFREYAEAVNAQAAAQQLREQRRRQPEEA